jgi:hypothetical protein
VTWVIPKFDACVAQLPAAKCVLFAGTSVAHALTVMPAWVHDRAAEKQRDSRLGVAQLRASLDRLLEWVLGGGYVPLEEHRWLLENCLPDPSRLYQGELDLWVVTDYCWECAAWPDDGATRARWARKAALESYTALSHWFVFADPTGRVTGVASVARRTLMDVEPTCVAELRFQIALLNFVEQMTIAADLTYDVLFTAVAHATCITA